MAKMYGLKSELGREILQALADGETSKHISEVWSVSYMTIRNHLLYMRGEIGAKNTLHLIAIAMRKNLIQ